MPDLNQYLISLDVLPDGTTGNIKARMREIFENGVPARDHLFSPRYLKEALMKFGEDVPKYVTIQACHSGGFLETDDAKLAEDTLVGVKNITAMTAARADRYSFGCNPGADRTMFGELYGRALALQLDDPRAIEWNRVFEQTRDDVALAEEKFEFTPSLPQYFTNQGADEASEDALAER
jgi:hypothetical protein